MAFEALEKEFGKDAIENQLTENCGSMVVNAAVRLRDQVGQRWASWSNYFDVENETRSGLAGKNRL